MNLVDYASALSALLKDVGKRAPTLKMKGKGRSNYVLDSVARKHVLARAHGVEWERTRVAVLRRLVPADRRELMASLPDSWTAKEASNMFCGRPDRPLLVSMYMRLWHDVADEVADVADARTILTKAVRDGTAKRAIEEFERRHGMPPTPHTLIVMTMTELLRPSTLIPNSPE